MYKDLCEFIEAVEQLGAPRRVDGADPQFEIGAITEVAAGRPGGPALLFDGIKGFPRGFRILTNAVTSAPRAALALGLDPNMRPLDALKARPDDATQSRRRAPSPSQPSSHRRRNRERLRTEKSSTRRATRRGSQCLRKRTPPALAMSVEPIGPCPNHEGEAAGIDVDCVAVYRLSVSERLDRNQVVPSRDQRIVFAALYLIVLVVDLLEVQCSYTDRDDAKDEQFALNRVPLAPTFRKWGIDRHEPSQRPNHMTVKGAFLHFVPCFGRGAIQYRRDIYYHCLASRTGAALIGPRVGRRYVHHPVGRKTPMAGIGTQGKYRRVAVSHGATSQLLPFASKAAEAVRPCTSAAHPKVDVNSTPWPPTRRGELMHRRKLGPRSTIIHSINSSARPDSGSGTVSPSALAVLRLIANERDEATE